MNCIEAQRLIMSFINDKLDINQLEEFINHVNSCPDCMEELEVYYVLLAGMKQLDEDKELSDDFHQDLMNILRQSEERIIHDKILHIRKRVILIVMITLIAITSSFRFGEYVVEDVLHNEVTESNYTMDDLFVKYDVFEMDHPFLMNREDILSSMILENLADIYVYLRRIDLESANKMQEHFGDQMIEESKNGKENRIN